MNATTKKKLGPAPRVGLRERNKLDKRQRIRAAARDLFARRGYEAATMRDIASRAHVALGTLFNYADDKRDLVFLIFNDVLDGLTDRALAAPRPDAAILGQLMAVFRCHYEVLAKNPALSRLLLQELTFYSQGKEAARFHAIRARFMGGIERLVRAAQEDGRIGTAETPAFIARYIFFVYSAALRWWIASPRPDVQRGLADLRRLLTLQLDGLRATAVEGPARGARSLPLVTRRETDRPRA
jgi:AcrR family transcriptional regulator